MQKRPQMSVRGGYAAVLHPSVVYCFPYPRASGVVGVEVPLCRAYAGAHPHLGVVGVEVPLPCFIGRGCWVAWRGCAEAPRHRFVLEALRRCAASLLFHAQLNRFNDRVGCNSFELQQLRVATAALRRLPLVKRGPKRSGGGPVSGCVISLYNTPLPQLPVASSYSPRP